MVLKYKSVKARAKIYNDGIFVLQLKLRDSQTSFSNTVIRFVFFLLLNKKHYLRLLLKKNREEVKLLQSEKGLKKVLNPSQSGASWLKISDCNNKSRVSTKKSLRCHFLVRVALCRVSLRVSFDSGFALIYADIQFGSAP